MSGLGASWSADGAATAADQPTMAADGAVAGLVARLRGEVAERLTARLRADEEAGRARLGVEDQRRLARSLLAQALERQAGQALADGRPVLDLAQEERVARQVLDALFGLGRLQPLLDDPEIENINANGCDQVFVRYADGRREPVDPIADSDAELVELLRAAASRLGIAERRFDLGTPSVNLRLPDGSRLFAVMAVAARPSLSIRRHRYQRLTLADEVRLGTLSPALRQVLAAAVRARRNLIICGDVGAGKTTLLRALAAEMPTSERLVTIEDTLELGLERHPELHPDVVALEARDANVEGHGRVTQAELVRWALRMSPDRVIVGEVRGEELVPMLNAMSMGTNGSMCTLHAGGSGEAFGKLATYAIQAPERLPLEATNLLVANAVHLVVFLDHDRASGRRQVTSVREVVGAEGAQVVSNEVFRPGRAGHAVPAAPLRTQTVGLLVQAGLDTRLLDPDGPWWATATGGDGAGEVGR